MTELNSRLNLGVFVLAGAGAGALAGAAVGLLALRRPQAQEEISETVDDLKRRAEMILTELSRSPALDAIPPAVQEQSLKEQEAAEKVKMKWRRRS